jgi:hypothetical protein
VALPAVFFDDATPDLSGPDIVSSTMPFTAVYDGTHPYATVSLMSTDTTV